jgi:hypothetical protein
MADSPNPTISKPPARFGRAKDFRVVYSNTFRFRVSNTEVAIALGYQTAIPDDQILIQDEVEVVFSPTHLKFLSIAMSDAVAALEKEIGTVQLPPELLEAIAKAKAAAAAAAEAEKK